MFSFNLELKDEPKARNSANIFIERIKKINSTKISFKLKEESTLK